MPSLSPSDIPSVVPSVSIVPSVVPSLSFGNSTFLELQREALVALYESADGASWVNNSNWLSNESICTWAYIECNKTSDSVLSISLQHQGLQGTLPTELGYLTEVTFVSFSHNISVELFLLNWVDGKMWIGFLCILMISQV